MDWVKLAQRYYLDPAIRGLPDDVADAAEIMFVRGLARAGEVGRGGFIPAQDVELLTRRRRHAAVVDALTGSGLWQAVPGGYQVTRWADWQDHLDALTRKRAADRERQRRRRAAAHNGTPPSRDTPRDSEPVDNGPSIDVQLSTADMPGSVRVHPDKRQPLSRDMSRDVTAVEREGELEGVKGGDIAHGGRPPDAPPLNGKPTHPNRCTRHAHDPDPPPCGACRDARIASEIAAAQQAQQRVDRDRTIAAGPRCPACANPTGSTYHRKICTKERT